MTRQPEDPQPALVRRRLGDRERGGAEEGRLRRQQRLREEAAAAARAEWAGWGPEGLLGAVWALEDCPGP